MMDSSSEECLIDMAYLLPRSLILHVPKTGSDWVRAACQASLKGPIREVGPWHCDLKTAIGLLREQGRPVPFIGTFVRHPLSWYPSAWCYWKETGRFPRQDDEPQVECDDFDRFVHNCLRTKPAGYVSSLFERFTGKRPGRIPFVGRQESLADDLVRLLRAAGESFEETALRSVPRQNVRAGRRDSLFPGYSFELASEVLRREHRAVERFYPGSWSGTIRTGTRLGQ